MGIFSIPKDVEKEEVKDSLGGGNFVWNTGVYDVKITRAFIDKSRGGAISVNLTLETPEGKKLDLTEYVTNKEGVNFYVDKNSGKKKVLPGLAKMNGLAELLVGKSLEECELEEKMVEVYDFDAGKRVARPKQVIMDLLNVPAKVGIIKVIDWKNQDKTETKEKNELDKVFDENGFTLAEKTAGEETSKFIEKYKENRKADYVKDKTGGKTKPSTSTNKDKKLPF